MPVGLSSPDWSVEGSTWPHHVHSRFLRASGHRWHLQRWGQGPRVLLVHGTGASTHSFAELAGILADHAELLLLDLPGHGFTQTPALKTISLQTVSEDIASLLRAEKFAPDVIIGHSAGAAVAHQLVLSEGFTPGLVISINGAFRSFPGIAKLIAPTLAKALYFNPLASMAIARSMASEDSVERLVAQIGSHLPHQNVQLYTRLLRYPGHISGALAMMSGWALEGMEAALVRSPVPSVFVVGENDRAVAPQVSADLADGMVGGSIVRIPNAGHLVHEEEPALVAETILRVLKGPSEGPLSRPHQEGQGHETTR